MVNLWHKLRQHDRIADLEHERDYLDKRLAEFERVARDFVACNYPDVICRMQFTGLLNEEEEESEP